MSASFDEFARLCERLAATTKKLEKRAMIAGYLTGLGLEDAALAAIYLAGQPFGETDRRALNVGGALLTKAVAGLSGASEAAMYAAYRKHGDLGAAAFDLLPANDENRLSIAGIKGRFDTLAAARGAAAKLPLLLDLLAHARPLAAKYLIKLMLGDMRTGVKQSLVEEAIAAAYNAEIAAVRRAMMLTGNLPEVAHMAATQALDTARMSLFHPLGFMLASPVESVEEALARFAEEVSAEEHSVESPHHAIRHAQMEDKYDGMRAQLHCGESSQSGRVEIFSRNRENIGASFPELTEAFSQLEEPMILDGEILAWDPASDPEKPRALPFSTLQQRLGRKRVTPEMRERVPVVFMAFDLLYLGEDLLLDKPLHERRHRLVQLVGRHAAMTGRRDGSAQATLFNAEHQGRSFPHLVLAPASRLESEEQLDRAYLAARSRGNEGVMIKSLASLYQPGRRGLAWLKLKRELATLDVVVTGAEFGHGRRASVLSDYTFAVRDGEELKNVGKAYSGLTDAEIEGLTTFFKEHTLEDSGHFRTVEPLVVLEVAFNNIMRSDRHASGFALRFPRILRIRTDKPVRETDTLTRVEEIYASQPDKPVEQATAE